MDEYLINSGLKETIMRPASHPSNKVFISWFLSYSYLLKNVYFYTFWTENTLSMLYYEVGTYYVYRTYTTNRYQNYLVIADLIRMQPREWPMKDNRDIFLLKLFTWKLISFTSLSVISSRLKQCKEHQHFSRICCWLELWANFPIWKKNYGFVETLWLSPTWSRV